MMWGNYGMGGWGFGILLAVGVVILVIVLIRVLARPRPASPQASSPKQILDERYAKGELTTVEYRERLTALALDS
ncbi:MAG: SHOCT domain-containing protein [Ilumatobacteraceae bacterium]